MAGNCVGHTMHYSNHVGYLLGRIEKLEEENKRLKQQLTEAEVVFARFKRYEENKSVLRNLTLKEMVYEAIKEYHRLGQQLAEAANEGGPNNV